jgi:hypothetical protein
VQTCQLTSTIDVRRRIGKQAPVILIGSFIAAKESAFFSPSIPTNPRSVVHCSSNHPITNSPCHSERQLHRRDESASAFHSVAQSFSSADPHAK